MDPHQHLRDDRGRGGLRLDLSLVVALVPHTTRRPRRVLAARADYLGGQVGIGLRGTRRAGSVSDPDVTFRSQISGVSHVETAPSGRLIVPNPRIPKVLGILNIVFAVCVLPCLAYTAMYPLM